MLSPITPIMLAFLFPGMSDPGTTFLAAAYKDRLRIHSGELIITVRFRGSTADPKSVGSTWAVHQWFDVEKGIFRVDRTISNDKHFTRTDHQDGFCWNGSDFKWIHEKESLMPLLQYSKIPSQPPDRFDPRILGLCIEQYGPLKARGLDDIKDLLSKASIDVNSDDRSESYTLPTGDSSTYFFSESGEPIVFHGTGRRDGPKVVYDATITNQIFENEFKFPKKIDLKVFVDGEIYADESTVIEIIQLNKDIDPSIFAWGSLGPKAGARLVVDGDYENQSRFWNGKRFEDVPPRLLKDLTADLMTYDNRSRVIMLLITTSLFLSLILYYRIRRGLPAANSRN